MRKLDVRAFLQSLVVMAVLAVLVAAFTAPKPSGSQLDDQVVLCGELPNSADSFGGPASTYWLGSGDAIIAQTVCDGLGFATEADADHALTGVAGPSEPFQVMGMWCLVSADPNNDVVLTMRSAVADLTPSVTCTIPGTGSRTTCTSTQPTAVDVARDADIAVKATTTENLSASDFWCKAFIRHR